MLTFEFTGVRGAMIRQESLTAGMVGKEVKLLFSREWDNLRKIAVFRAGNVTRDVLDVEGQTVIPAKVLEAPLHRLYVGIYGTNAAGDRVVPTVWAEGPMVEEGAVPSGDPSTEKENPVWQQIMTNVGDLKELNTSARENLVAAINEAAVSGSGSGECSGMPLPETAAAGQFIRVAAVDETGKVTSTEAVEVPDSGGNVGYVLPVGGDELGGVKNGGNVVINPDGTMTAPTAVSGDDSDQSAEVIEDIEIVATEGKFAKWITGEASGGAESSVSWAAHSQFIPVTPGETLRITCRAANVCPGIVFYSTNTMSAANGVGYALENPGTGDPNTGSLNRYTYTDEDVVVPDGASYAILNHADGTGYTWKCQKVTVVSGGNDSNEELEQKLANAEYENEQLVRRVTNAEKCNDFAWGTFDKAYFVFVHDDSREFITTAYNAFHAKGVPVSAAAIAPYLGNTHDGKTVKEWLELIVADGGEVLCHYSYDLKDSDDDSVWYEYVVDAKREFEQNGFNVRGLILASSSDVNSAKGEKFCRRYFDYADKVGTSTRYNLGRKGMWTFASLDAFKARIDSCAQTPGIYAFGFHGNRDDETWITEDSLKEVIDYISAKDNCEITTYSAVFDAIGTTVLEKRVAALEAK